MLTTSSSTRRQLGECRTEPSGTLTYRTSWNAFELLAAALGAQVYKGSISEIGGGEIRLTAEGVEDPVLGGGDVMVPVIHWHEDTFDLPSGAVHLARSTLYPIRPFVRAGMRTRFNSTWRWITRSQPPGRRGGRQERPLPKTTLPRSNESDEC